MSITVDLKKDPAAIRKAFIDAGHGDKAEVLSVTEMQMVKAMHNDHPAALHDRDEARRLHAELKARLEPANQELNDRLTKLQADATEAEHRFAADVRGIEEKYQALLQDTETRFQAYRLQAEAMLADQHTEIHETQQRLSQAIAAVGAAESRIAEYREHPAVIEAHKRRLQAMRDRADAELAAMGG